MNPTVRLDAAARLVFGEEWAGALSRCTGASLRTCQRAKAAADDGKEYGRSLGLLEALDDRLVMASMTAASERPEPNVFLSDDDEDHDAIVNGIRQLSLATARASYGRGERRVFGPFKDYALTLMFDHLAGFEERLVPLCRALVDQLGRRPTKESTEHLHECLSMGLETTRALYGRRTDGTFELLAPPRSLITTAPDIMDEAQWACLLLAPAGDDEIQAVIRRDVMKSNLTMAGDDIAFSLYDAFYGDLYGDTDDTVGFDEDVSNLWLVAKVTRPDLVDVVEGLLAAHGFTATRRPVFSDPPTDDEGFPLNDFDAIGPYSPSRA